MIIVIISTSKNDDSTTIATTAIEWLFFGDDKNCTTTTTTNLNHQQQQQQQHSGTKSKQKDGRWALMFDEFVESIKCLGNLIEDSRQNQAESCCRYDAFKQVLVERAIIRCPRLESEPEKILHLFTPLNRYMNHKCKDVDTDTFACQMMSLVMTN
ncbi:hypothetical protein HUG17_2902 [Dermatophagoides farinae]|uniref:Uncharacterized protein n=1 Tax=Dermatophagoides farinae TaxID=6954 RepID=A0A9D4NV75_DERFA|nr:hypothetical protein HUG17_2902 [Dermatophagoides farinae]